MNFHGGDVHSYSKGILDFSSNINPLGVPQSFKLALASNIEEFTKYPDINYIELRTAIAEYLEVEDIGNVLPGNGAIELIYRGIAACGKKRLLGLKPTFSEYSRAARQQGIVYEGLSCFTEEYQSVDVQKIIQASQEDSTVVICNPNNPTGTLLPKHLLIELAEALKAKGAFLIIDEAFMEFTEGYPQNSMLDQIFNFDNLLIVKAATKFFGMPGIRLGYAISGNRSLLLKMKESMEPWNINTAAMIAGRTIFKDYEYIKNSRQWIQSERPYMMQELQGIPSIKAYATQANFHLVHLEEKTMDAWQLKERLVLKNLLIRTPEGFEGLDGSFVRIAIKDRKSNEKLLYELKQIFYNEK